MDRENTNSTERNPGDTPRNNQPDVPERNGVIRVSHGTSDFYHNLHEEPTLDN